MTGNRSLLVKRQKAMRWMSLVIALMMGSVACGTADETATTTTTTADISTTSTIGDATSTTVFSGSSTSTPQTTTTIGQTSSPSVAETTSTTSGVTTTTTDFEDQLPPGVLDAIIADAAGRAAVLPEQVQVDDVIAESFPDASLGCPEPGKFYAQVITPGFQVLIDAYGLQLDYRVDGQTGDFKLCES